MTTYGNIEYCQDWIRYCLVDWWRQATTWADVDIPANSSNAENVSIWWHHHNLWLILSLKFVPVDDGWIDNQLALVKLLARRRTGGKPCHEPMMTKTYNVMWCPLQCRHNGRDSVSNHQPQDCLLNRLFRRRSKKISKLRVTGVCAGNSPVTGEFPAQMASNAENFSTYDVIMHWHSMN